MGSKSSQLKTLKQLILGLSICLCWERRQGEGSVHFQQFISKNPGDAKDLEERSPIGC